MDNSSYQPIVLHLDDNHEVIQVIVEDLVRPITVHLGPFTSWDSVRDKPGAFPPADHQHGFADTEGLDEALAVKPDDAPVDGRQYARIDGAWAEVDGLPDQTGHQGKALVTDGTRASWQEQTGSSGGDVEEAPQDGQLYFRHNGAWTAVSDTFLETTPVGLTALWDGSDTIPSGWLECDGSQITEAEYPELFALYRDRIEAGKAFLPDYRGEFIRGWDHGRGVDAERALGSYQGHEVANHAHEVAIAINESKWDTMPFGTSADPAVVRGQYHDLGTGDLAEGNEQWMLSNSRGGGETRPRNCAAMVIIKAIAGPNLVSQLAVPQRSVYSGIAGQQTFSHNYEINRPVSVFVDGLKLIKDTHFTADTGTDIQLNTPLAADADVEIESLGKLTLHESNSDNLQTQIDSLSDDVSQIQTQVATQGSGLTQVQSQVATQANDLTQLQLDVNNQGNDVVQLQTDITSINSGLSQAQNDIGTINSGLNQARSEVSDLQSNMNTNFSDLVPRVETLENRAIPPDLSAAFADLTARVAALENPTPTEPPADGDDDMKLLGTETLTNGTEFVFDSLMDDTVYGSYLLVLNNVVLSGTESVQQHMGLSIQQSSGGSFWDGYGAFRMKVLAHDGTTTPVAKEYLGLRLMDDTFASVTVTGQITITPGGSGLGAITGHLQTGNGDPYLYATMSAEWGGAMHGIKLFASVADKLSGSVSLYGLKK